MNVLERGLDFLNRKLRAAAGFNAAYARGGNSFPFVAVLGSTAAAQPASDNGATIETRYRDILIESAEFDFETFKEPQKGDRITVGANTYQVTVRQGIGSWTWSDPLHSRLRIFVKEVKP